MATTFEERLREARISKGLTQAELAELIDEKLRPERYSLYENGKSVPHPNRMKRIAQVLEVDEDWLSGGVRAQKKRASEDLRDQLLAAKDEKIAALEQEIGDLREVALDVSYNFEHYRKVVEEEVSPFFFQHSDERIAEIVRNSCEWAADLIERQLDSLSQRSRRESENLSRPTRDGRPVAMDDSRRSYARKLGRHKKNHPWPGRVAEKPSDGAAEST